MYPNYGCNNEIYIKGDFLEVESSGPLTKLAPNKSVEHIEKWLLVPIKSISIDNEDLIEQTILPLINSLYPQYE